MPEPLTGDPGTTQAVTSPPPASTQPSTSPPPPAATGGTAGVASAGSSPAVTGATAVPGATPAGSGSGLSGAQSPATQALAGQQQPATGSGVDYRQQYEAAQAELARLQPLARIGYQTWQQQQQAAQQPATPAAPAKPPNAFGLPEFDHGLIQFIKRGSGGELVVDPAAPPDTLARYQAYMQKFQEVQPQFWQDPMKFLGPQIQQMAQQIADQRMQAHMGGYQEQVQARTILERNADWLYAKDAQGQRQFQTDQLTGQTAPVLSPYGQAYARFVREAGDMGITSAAKQDQYATAMLQNAIHNARAQQQQGQQQGQQAAGQFLTNAATQAASPPPPGAAVSPPPPPGPISMREKLRQAFQQNGVTDQTIMANGAA